MMMEERRVIVIGSGPSGTMAALTLLRRGIPVTMLESGHHVPRGLLVRAMGRNVYRHRPSLHARHNPPDHVVSGDPDTLWCQELVPGGLSNHWTGAVPRFAPEDFFEGERLHERYRWPLSYEDLVPYYEQAERLLTIVGRREDVACLPAPRVAYSQQLPAQWQPIAARAASFGQGLTVMPIADGPPWMISGGGVAFNSFTRIVPLLQRFPQFQLILGAHVLRLESRGKKTRIDSIVYLDRSTLSEQRLACAAVVVAAGPLGSTKLLLQSTSSDFPHGLGNTEGLLGQYLHDHAVGWCEITVDRAVPRLPHPAYLTRMPYNESPPLLAASCTLGRTDSTRWETLLAMTPLKARAVGVVSFGTVVPVPENYVRLHPTATGRFGLPRLDIHIRYQPETERAVSAAQARLLAIFDAAGYAGKIHNQMIKPPGASVHYGGTVRMHSSAKHGVLNGWNRLHVVDNVVVADASCFTTGVEKNPTLTVMALAARASHSLAEDLKSGHLSGAKGRP